MRKPFVSLIITSYNRPVEFEQAFISAVDQTYSNYEIIVVDDFSSKENYVRIESVINEYSKIKVPVKLIKHKRNSGLSIARNTGVNVSKGEFLCFLDDDDFLALNSISTRIDRVLQINNIENTIIQASWEIIKIPSKIHFVQKSNLIQGNIRDYIMSNWFVTHSGTVFFSRRIFDLINGFDGQIKSSVDHDLWMKFAEFNLQVVTIDSPLAFSYHFMKRKSIVNDVDSRIEGVETFLTKWGSAIELWIGEKKQRKYISQYREKVFTDLIVRKLFSLDWINVKKIYKHLKDKNMHTIKTISIITVKFTYSLARKLFPDYIVAYFRKF